MTRILVAGVGGQGVLMVAAVLGDAALAAGVPVVLGQTHGMAQRGGSVRVPVILGSARSAFFSAGEADILLGLDPLEAARAAPWLRPGGLALVSVRGVPLRGAPSTEALLAAIPGLVRVQTPSARLAGPAVLGAFAALSSLLPASKLSDAFEPAAREAFARALQSHGAAA